MHASTLQPASPTEEGTTALGRWPLLGWALLYLLVAGAIQLYIPYPLDADTAYHAAVGNLIREHGILHSFPWTPFSWLADHYADKELLFHLFFVPLAGLNWITASRIVGTFACATLLFSVCIVLRAERVRLAGLWALAPLAASSYFVFRCGVVRPFILSIALAVLLLWGAYRERFVLLAVVAFIYPWLYVAYWQIPCILLTVVEAARLLSGERMRWRPAAVTAGGIVLGVALHPNALNLIGVSWINMTEMLFRSTWGGRGGFEMGRELRPFTVSQWTYWLVFPVVMAAVGVVLAWRNRKGNGAVVTFALATLAFGALTVTSGKFSEYFIPFSAALLALTARFAPWRHLPLAVVGASLLYTLTVARDTITGMARRADDLPPATAAFLRQQIPAGAQVFTSDWDFTGTLMLALPDRRFIVALDPTFFYAKDPELYREWYRLVQEAPPGSAEIIRRRFGARYVLGHAFADRTQFFFRIAAEPGVRSLLISDSWMLFDLGGGAGSR